MGAFITLLVIFGAFAAIPAAIIYFVKTATESKQPTNSNSPKTSAELEEPKPQPLEPKQEAQAAGTRLEKSSGKKAGVRWPLAGFVVPVIGFGMVIAGVCGFIFSSLTLIVGYGESSKFNQYSVSAIEIGGMTIAIGIPFLIAGIIGFLVTMSSRNKVRS